MISHPPLEVRLELYSDGILDRAVVDKISALLAARWSVSWEIKVPPSPSFDHPARWHAIVPRGPNETPQALHQRIVADLAGVDPTHAFRFRTRWDFVQSPNEQEVFEERWTPSKE